jgi:hypothetical protein
VDTSFIVPTLALLLLGAVVAFFAMRDRGSAASVRAARLALDEVARLMVELIEQGRVVTEQERIIRQLTRQLLELGVTPAARINGVIKAAKRGEKPLQTLHELIVQRFNEGEINELAFGLGIEHENLSGETRAALALSLIDYCTRHDLLQELVAACIRLRPTVEWPKIP